VHLPGYYTKLFVYPPPYFVPGRKICSFDEQVKAGFKMTIFGRIMQGLSIVLLKMVETITA
jgi:hypothetical protein